MSHGGGGRFFLLTEQIETDPTWQTYKQNKSKQTKLVSNKSLPNQRTEPTRQTYKHDEPNQTKFTSRNAWNGVHYFLDQAILSKQF